MAASGNGKKSLSEHILLQNFFQRLRTEKLKTAFHFLKEKKEKKMTN